MGAKDKYMESKDANGNRQAPPKRGYEGNVMADSTGRASGENILDIIENATASFLQWLG
ncbi:hypothetical protein SAMN05216359_102256 [Roseateles sp. YR242]|uniref:hypothetical protein n=1 Tax=Roseateles sp. YR242 TaxID=1855305 RepID=UPI0008CE00C8|nr:hypothetical protein [Roseateles sp. YR242]SEK57539.1 hypothetical protein SAMN05216359_102256 [Roseateles sp. YR242]